MAKTTPRSQRNRVIQKMRQRERFAKVFRCIAQGNNNVHSFGVHHQTTKAMMNRNLISRCVAGGMFMYYMTEEGINYYNEMKEGVYDV